MRRHGGVSDGVESPHDRITLSQDAGVGAVSAASALVGTLVAVALTVLVLALAAAVVTGTTLEADLRVDNWRDAGVAGGAILAGVLFFSFLFGGYAAGRMARRRGVLHGVMVFVTSLVAVAAATVIARLLTDADADTVLRNLRSVGVPTTGSEWRDVATVAGVASLVAMLAGSVLGGMWGERWHSRLMARALDPEVGREGQLRREAAEIHDDAEARAERTHVGGGVDLRDRARDSDDGEIHDDAEPAENGRRRFLRR
ncbi:MAG: hypothetical protein QOG87_1014 [Actinomycetota bacterium]|jgi:hypothetical protein